MAQVVHSFEELENEIKRRMRMAMEEAAKKTMEDLKAGTEYFYEGSYPMLYARTGALGDTPDVSPVSVDGFNMSYVAKLKQTHNYTTGDRPSMAQVLKLANYGNPWITAGGNPARANVGRRGFWEKSVKDAERDIQIAFKRNLHK